MKKKASRKTATSNATKQAAPGGRRKSPTWSSLAARWVPPFTSTVTPPPNSKAIVVSMRDIRAVVEHMKRCCFELECALAAYDPANGTATLYYPIAGPAEPVAVVPKAMSLTVGGGDGGGDGGGGEVFNCKILVPPEEPLG